MRLWLRGCLFASPLLGAPLACSADAGSTGAAIREAPAPAPATAPAEPPASAPPELRPAPADGAIAPLVAGELAAARGDARLLVVYVGARWCEPCVAFHDAVVRGELDAALPGVRFLEFDLDRDAQRLAEADYQSRYIPLFALPQADGRAGPGRVEGGIKGDGAVEHIMGRLGALIAAGR